VRPRAGEPANLFLAELALAGGASAASGRPKEMPPLSLFRRVGEYTAEAEAILSGPR